MVSPLHFTNSYWPDSRGNRVEDHGLFIYPGEQSARLLCMRGPEEAVVQIEAALGARACIRIPVAQLNFEGEMKYKYNYCLEFPADVPEMAWSLVELLTDIVTLHISPGSPLRFATALDFYKSPQNGMDPMNWPNTRAGGWVNAGKYQTPGPARKQALHGLSSRVTEVLTIHPVYREATTIVSVPGHRADGRSWGERLARHISKVTGKDLVAAVCPSGPRQQMKGGASAPLPLFEIEEDLSGEHILVVDDVYRTGSSMAQSAHAARASGAAAVSGFVIARTLSN
jgi:hypothetical protein